MTKTKTVCYYIPYSTKAMYLLRKIKKLYKAEYSIENEEVTITAPENKIAQIERTLASVC